MAKGLSVLDSAHHLLWAQAPAAARVLAGGCALGAYTGALLLWGAAAKWAVVGRLEAHPGYSIYSALSWRRMLMGAIEVPVGAPCCSPAGVQRSLGTHPGYISGPCSPETKRLPSLRVLGFWGAMQEHLVLVRRHLSRCACAAA